MNPLVVVLLAVDMGGAARDLARGVAAAVAHEPAAVTVRNVSSLAPADAGEIRRVFEAELKGAGPPAADIQLTISENLTQYLLIAQIQRGGERQVLLESWPRVPQASSGMRVTLEKKLLWEQYEPILDAAQSGDTILVLDAARVLWIQPAERQTAPIAAARPWPRDLRGRLSLGGGAFTAWLPGIACKGSLQPRLAIECRESQDPWLLGPGALATFSPAGNFFPGHVDVEPGGVHELAPFYSAAPIAADTWIFAGTDGRARVYTRSWEVAGEIPQWGSDLAAIQTPCGARILVTRRGGPGESDAIQPYDLAGATPHLAGRALEFPGPITALWSAGASAMAVTRDLQTGRYAAYSLAPACGT